MRAINLVLISAALLCCANASFFSHKTEILDEVDQHDVKIAEAVCKVTRRKSKQINRPSTVLALSSIIKLEAPWESCYQKYNPSISLLSKIIQTSNDNVCSNEKIALIEKFHRYYISKAQKYIHWKDYGFSFQAPNILKLFFLHYATEVSNICARSALTKLNKIINPESDDKESVLDNDQMIKSYYESMDIKTGARGFEEMFMIWRIVDNLPSKKIWKLAPYLSRGLYRINLSLNDDSKLREAQDICKKYIRPIYRESLLPVIRLVDMGYYPEDDAIAVELTKNRRLINLNRATQLCETIIPIRLFQDKGLAPKEIRLLRADQVKFAIKDDHPVREKEVNFEPFDSSMDIEKPLPSLNAASAQDKLEKIKKNLRSRSMGFNRLFENLIHSLRSKFDPHDCRVYLAKTPDGKDEGGRIEREFDPALIANQIGEYKEEAVESTKRKVLKNLAYYTAFVFLAFSGILLAYIIALYIYKYAIFMPLKGIYEIWSFFSGERSLNAEKALAFGNRLINNDWVK